MNNQLVMFNSLMPGIETAKDAHDKLQEINDWEALSGKGAYVDSVLTPGHDEEVLHRKAVVKVIKDISRPYEDRLIGIVDYLEKENLVDEAGLNEVMYLGDDIDKKTKERIRNLSIEHQIHKKYLGEYLLPTFITNIEFENQVVGRVESNQRRLRALTANGKKFDEQDREVLFEKGGKAIATVTPFIGVRQSIMSSFDPDELSPEVKMQLNNFLYALKTLNAETGLMIDHAFLRSDSDNLVVVNGKLILLDSNNLLYDPEGMQLAVIEREIKYLLSGEFE